MPKQKLLLQIVSANAKETGRPYQYVSIKIEDVELPRIYIKDTEKSYYASLIGEYEKSSN